MNRVRKLGGVEGENEKNNKLWNSCFTEGGRMKEAGEKDKQAGTDLLCGRLPPFPDCILVRGLV